MTADANIFREAAKRVSNKGVLARVGHSAALHMFRSAVSSKGSAASKGSKVALAVGRAALQLIPIPVVANLASAVEQKLEGFVRGKLHQHRLETATSTEDRAKFSIKEMSIEDLDRYRWKVHTAMQEVNEKVPKIKATDKQTCNECFEVAMAIAQAERRIDRLKEAIKGLQDAIDITNQWIKECETGTNTAINGSVPVGGLIGLKNDMLKVIADRAGRFNALPEEEKEARIALHKADCSDWCQITQVGGMNETAATARQWAANVARVTTSPFTYENFLTVKKDDYEVAKDK